MKDKIKNIFYFFNYFEWLCVILVCILFKFLLYLADGSGFLIAMQALICILLSAFILAMKSENLEALAEKYVDEHDDLFIKTNGLHSFKDVPTAEMIDIPIHSTEIRDRFLKFKSIRPYINRDAWDIMNENRTKLTKLYESIAKHKK